MKTVWNLTIRHITSRRDQPPPPPNLFLAANIMMPKFTLKIEILVVIMKIKVIGILPPPLPHLD